MTGLGSRPVGKPDLFGKTFTEANAERTRAQHLAVSEDVRPMPTRAEVAESKQRDKDGTFAPPPPTTSGSAPPTTDNVRSGSGQTDYGNAASYLIRRIKRDATTPTAQNHTRAADALARLQRGEIKSARRAAIDAGIVRVPTAMDVARKAVRKLTGEEWRELVESETVPKPDHVIHWQA